MSKRQISPFGCKDCKHVFVDRCGLTGHKIQWHVNAAYHCAEFGKVKNGHPDSMAKQPRNGRVHRVDTASAGDDLS